MHILRVFLIGIVVVLLFGGVMGYMQERSAAQEFAPDLSASVAAAVPVASSRITGALVMYTTGSIETPYVFYEVNGIPMTKALAFNTQSNCQDASGNLSCENLRGSYTDTQIDVEGDVTSAHILVRILLPSSAPDPRISLVRGGLGDHIATLAGFAIVPDTFADSGDGVTLQADVVGATSEALFFREGTIVPVSRSEMSLAQYENGQFVFAIER